MSAPVVEKEEFLESKAAIADYLGISENTLDAWRKDFNKKHPNPLPVGKMGRSLISTKAKLAAWKAWFIEHAETQSG